MRRPSRPHRMHGRLIAATVTLTLVAAACGGDDDDAEPAASATTAAETTADATAEATAGGGAEFGPGVLESGATIAIFERGDVTVHTHTNPEAGFGNTTTVFESENALVLVDAHFSEASAAEFRAYADSLGKPIERLLITHEHPDHIGGVDSVFADVTSASSAGVVAAVADAGTTIDETIEAGEEVIDGVRYVFDVYEDAEAPEQLVISLPDEGVMAIGDLIYFDYHYVMSPTFDNWLSILTELEAREGIELVIPGHGAPAGREAFENAFDYLETAAEIYDASDDGETFGAEMVAAFPDREGANLLEFGLGRLFPKSGS